MPNFNLTRSAFSAEPNPTPMLDISEVAKRLGVSTADLRYNVYIGKFPRPMIVHQLTRWPTSVIDQWIEENCPEEGID